MTKLGGNRDLGPIFCILCQRQHQTPTSHTAARFWYTFYHNPLMPNVLFYLFLWTGPCSIEGVSDWFLSLSFIYKNSCTITKTCLYNFDPLEPHFYIEKTGVYRGIHYFTYFCSKHRLWVPQTLGVRGWLVGWCGFLTLPGTRGT